jgi:hypothetical protein
VRARGDLAQLRLRQPRDRASLPITAIS